MDNQVEYSTGKNQMPGISYRYALSFLASQPKPTTDQHVTRLVRLMAYDIVLASGRKGSEATGVFAASLRGVHATRGNLMDEWDWEFDGMVFSARPAPCEDLPEISLPDTHQGKLYELNSSQWLQKFQELPVPDPSGQISEQKPKMYPDPPITIESACLLALEVATMLSSVEKAHICWFPSEGRGVEVSMDTSKFKQKATRRHTVNHSLYK